jgi:uncharacterized membrane protein YphA (DoxX/SURF4 family)
MNLTLWVIAVLLAAIFLAGGVGKLILRKERIAAHRPFGGWAEDFSGESIKAIGVLEILAAVGLVLPAALDIAPILVPLAAVGLVMVMAGAMVTHLRRHEATPIAVNLVCLALAGFVAWGRFGPESSTG